MLRLRPLPLLLLAALPLCSFATDKSPATRPFEVRDLVNLERVSEPALSRDGSMVVFSLRQTDYAANKGVTSLWIRNLSTRDLASPKRLLVDGMAGNSPVFAPDGNSVYFISSKSGSDQIWRQSIAGGAAAQVTNYPLDVGSFKLSPDGKSLALSMDVFTDCNGLACTKKRLDDTAASKVKAVLFDKLFIRHWDTWVDGRRSQLFTAALGGDGKAATQPVLVSRGIDGDVPSKPFGDASEYNWSPDGKSLAFNARIAGRTEPWSTNFDVFIVSADGAGTPRNLTAMNKAWDAAPVFSNDGKTLYYRAMKHPGFEADRFALMAMDLKSGTTREIDPAWDRSADGITLSADGKAIYTTAEEMGERSVFSVNIATGAVKKIAGGGTVGGFDLAGDTLAFTRANFKSPDQLFVARADGSAMRQVTHNNEDRLKDVAFGDYEQFSFAGWNGDTVHGYVIKPWNYQQGRKYPVAFLIHGGPQGSWLNEFHYRWNAQTYAGQGYAVVEVDFHGSTGYGQAFTDAISQHWGDRPLEDLQKGWAAALQKYSFLDRDNACALGASYGGSMIYWIAGNWSSPWKCLVAHDGVFDNRMMGYSTEELWFSEHESGGTPWENPEGYERFNPIDHVKDWKVPMLVVHSQMDLRIPVEQGIAAFTALQRKGIESKYLYFPNENHWVLKPQDSVLWHDTVNAWLKGHIGQQP
jgi:dipeptidyl aminopeptidase/acylaminoacyl peptidase